MEWKKHDLEFDNNVPIYVQLVEELKILIISGKLEPGERLLSVREFALKMKVNPNTMQKALGELEDLKLIYTERTNGKFVTNDKKIIDKFKRNCADELVKNFLENMSNIGFNSQDVIKCIKNYKEDR